MTPGRRPSLQVQLAETEAFSMNSDRSSSILLGDDLSLEDPTAGPPGPKDSKVSSLGDSWTYEPIVGSCRYSRTCCVLGSLCRAEVGRHLWPYSRESPRGFNMASGVSDCFWWLWALLILLLEGDPGSQLTGAVGRGRASKLEKAYVPAMFQSWHHPLHQLWVSGDLPTSCAWTWGFCLVHNLGWD